MDSALIRLAAQVAMTTWAITQIVLLVSARGRVAAVTGVRWATFGLACFAAWMFLLSVSGVATGLVQRGDILWPLALLETGTAIGAWGWLIANVRVRFKINGEG
jgi:hypothetical protein